MALTLPPELETIVVEDAHSSGYPNAQSYLVSQLTKLHEVEVYLRDHQDSLAAVIEEGWLSGEREGWLTAEEVKAQMKVAKTEFLSQRSAA